MNDKSELQYFACILSFALAVLFILPRSYGNTLDPSILSLFQTQLDKNFQENYICLKEVARHNKHNSATQNNGRI